MRSAIGRSILISGLVLLLRNAPAVGQGTVSLEFFQDQLAPYGQWTVSASFGDVWVPRISSGWTPYVNGEWIYTDYGWTWVSADPFDIPFHYGTWAWDDRFGWVWVPGTIWAPAWVTWAITDDYVGWAPLPPTFELTASGYVGSPVVVTETRYVFVPTNRFVGVNVSTARVPAQQNTTIFQRTTKVTSFNVSGGIVRNVGPQPARIEKAAGKKIEKVSVDRVKARPTSLSSVGAKSGRIPVAAPAAERSSVIRVRGGAGQSTAPGAQAAPRPGEAARPAERERAEKPRPEARPQTGEKPEARPEKGEKPPERARTPERRRGEKPEKPEKPTPKPES